MSQKNSFGERLNTLLCFQEKTTFKAVHGTSTGLWQFTSGDAATDDAVATSEIELLGILTGVADATALVVGDFVFA